MFKSIKNLNLVTKIASLSIFTVLVFGSFQVSGFLNKSGSHPLKELRIFSKILLELNDNYVDPKRIKPKDILESCLESLERSIQELVIKKVKKPKLEKKSEGIKKSYYQISIGEFNTILPLKKPISIWDVQYSLSTIIKSIESYIPKEYERKEIEYSLIHGMLSTLDPHTSFLDEDNFKEMKLGTSGEFGGLGIVIGIRDGKLTVISPMEGTPAFRAGIKAKDIIAKIENESTASMTLTEAVNRLRGKPKTKVVIWVDRKGFSEPQKFSITRDIIKIIAVKSKLLEKDIGYIKIRSFNEKLGYDFRYHIESLKQKAGKDLEGLIIDFRNNPGGILNQAILLVDQLIGKGVIVSTEERGKKGKEFKARNLPHQLDYPMVVLINGGSASASEIVAGALKNHKRAIILGSQSFGKGSVQILKETFWDKSALKMTIAQWLTPGDIGIQNIGISPHFNLFEVNFQKKYFNYFIQPKNWKESDYEKSLFNTRAARDKPIYSLKYIGMERNEENFDDEYSKIKVDFPIQAASQIIPELKLKGFDWVIKNHKKVFAPLKESQKKKQFNAFKKLGIDWSGNLKKSKTKNLSAKIFISPNKKTYRPGEKITIKIKIKNLGKSSIYQVYGVMDSPNSFLRDREFVFGKIAPKKSKSWDLNLKIPATDLNLLWNLRVLIKNQSGKILAKPEKNIIISNQNLPRFIVHRTLVEQGDSVNGKLDNGELIKVNYKIKNVGKFPAKEITAYLRNKSSDFLTVSAGRASIKNLKPGKEGTFSMAFKVLKKPERKRKNLRLVLNIVDSGTGSFSGDMLLFNSKENFTFDRKMEIRNAPVKIELSKASWQNMLKGTGLFSGHLTVKNQKDLKDLAVFANNKKILYLNKFKKNSKMAISFIPEKKENTLTIICRNKNRISFMQNYLLLNPGAVKK